MVRGRKPGTPKTGGRAKGTKNSRSVERDQLVTETAEKMREAGIEIFDGDAQMLLMSVYKDKSQPLAVRIDAAKAAIRYEVPALANIQHKEDPAQFEKQYEQMDIMETARRMAFIFATADKQIAH